MFPKDQTALDMLDRPPDAVLDFIRHNLDSVDGTLPWQQLARALSEKVISESVAASSNALDWASAAVLLLDRLGDRCDEERTRYSSIKAAMSLRAHCLNAFGAERGHTVLDPMILEAWFFRGLEWRYERAAQMMQAEDDLTPEESKSLNRLKDRIRILKSVAVQEHFLRPDELAMWYEFLSS
jgi:hypothetical protein